MLFAFSLLTLSVAVGGAIDYSRAADAKRRLQDALDSAVIAAAVTPPGGNVGTRATNAFNLAISQSGLGAEVSGLTPNLPSAGASEFGADASAGFETAFLGIIGIDELPIQAEARATPITGGRYASAEHGCVYFTDPKNRGLEIENGGKFEADCTVHLWTRGNSVKVHNGGELAVGGVCARGSFEIASGAIASHTGSTPGCNLILDPFSNMQDPAESEGGCTRSGTYVINNGQSETFGEGINCGKVIVKNGGTLTLAAGIHTFKGGLQIDEGGEMNGEDVLVVFKRQTNEYDINGKLDIEGRRSGEYQGFVIFHEDYSGNSNRVNIGQNAYFVADGVIYLPNTRIWLYSQVQKFATRSLLVTDRIKISANASFTATIVSESDTPLPNGIGESGVVNARLSF
ncbi:MAG: pilus assembly protein TadG-related protein, partial [Pseudomonadota bacterium]